MRYARLSQAHKKEGVNLLNGLTKTAKKDGQPLPEADRQTTNY